jgi:hypothetical protein
MNRARCQRRTGGRGTTQKDQGDRRTATGSRLGLAIVPLRTEHAEGTADCGLTTR